MAFFVEPLLRHHDPAVVEVFAYSGVAAPDAVTRRMESLVPRWRSMVGLDTDRLFDLIRADGIDILVDFSGHTQGNRLDVFARRPAPVQITGIGYPGSTGLGVFDGRLCDAVTDPPENDAFSSEPPLRLGTGMHCYLPPDDAPPPRPRDGGPPTFGSFNKLAKVSDAAIDLWARVLRRVPDALLKLKSKPLAEAATRDDIAARFAAAGVGRDRLILSGWLPEDRDHLAAYHDVDVALDTFPYNGTTTTCEALWMGVPVLTLAGRGHAARVGASLMTSAGLTGWIVERAEMFAPRAAVLCGDRSRLAQLRRTLRGQVQASPLCDGKSYARGVEDAYRALWRRACGA
jgi:predicted O-linked N-acetylglucosamine transferase (SPINDLY family)